MISNQIIQSSISDLCSITGINLTIVDMAGTLVAGEKLPDSFQTEWIEKFCASEADSQIIDGIKLQKIVDEEEPLYVVAAADEEKNHVVQRIAVAQLGQLCQAYREKLDRNNFYQNLILDNMLLVDIHNKAKRLHLDIQKPRAVFLIETKVEGDTMPAELLRGMYGSMSGDHVTSVDEKNVILIKILENEDKDEECLSIAHTIVDMMNTEAMQNVRVAYGNIVEEMKDVSKSYKEAKMALDVGKIFYEGKNIVAYKTLGIGRLIYQLPINLCKMFIGEIFGDEIPDELDEETLSTVQRFFDNNLNVSETSRQLFVHRNTLVYRIEKLQKSIGLDIRSFDDAMTLKIALMVVNYMKYLEENEL